MSGLWKVPWVAQLLTLVLACALAACGSMGDTRSPALKTYAEARGATQLPPAANLTPFAGALQCSAGLVQRHGVRLTMLVEDIPDKTAKAAASASDMFLTAMSQMAQRSGMAIRTQTYGPDVRGLIELTRLSGSRAPADPANLPDVVVRGAVTQYDDGIARNTVDAGGSIGPLGKLLAGLGLARSTSVNLIATDLHVVDARSFALVPGASAHNVAAIVQEGQGTDAEVSYQGRFGANYGRSQARADGKTVAMRNLIELSAVELVGRQAKLPYWRCLGQPDDHPEVMREVDAWFDAMSTPEKLRFFRSQFAAMGMMARQGEVEPAIFRLAFRAYADALKVPGDALSRELFRAHFRSDLSVVGPRALRAFEAKRRLTPEVALAATATTRSALDLQLSLSVPGYVSCFHQAGEAKPFKPLAPSRGMQAGPIPAGLATPVRELVQAPPGRAAPAGDALVCVASGRDRRQETADAWADLNRAGAATDLAALAMLRERLEAKGEYVTMAATQMSVAKPGR